jgi:hypothetical protein
MLLLTENTMKNGIIKARAYRTYFIMKASEKYENLYVFLYGTLAI